MRYVLILRSFLFILIVSSFSVLHAEENIINGLLFNSIYDVSEGRNSATSLTIPSKDAVFYETNLTIDFDVFFWRKNPFGFILSAGNEQDPNLFVLSYSDYKSQDTSFIELTYADRPSIISIPILDKNQGWGKWKNIKLYFEKEKERVGLSFQNQNIIWYKENIPIYDRMQFNFGSTSFVVEPPRMAIKNINLNRDDKKTISWKLDEEIGDIAHPSYEDRSIWAGQLDNGIWIHELHRQLNPVFTHKVYRNNFQFLGSDNQSNQYLYLMNDSLFYYDNKKGRIVDKAPLLNLNKITGGRAVISGHILTDYMDIFAANERGPNFLYVNENGIFKDVAENLGVEDTFENGRGTTLTDFLYRGKLDIISGNWNGEHRIFLNKRNKFKDIANSEFKIPSRVRTIISADFDNDGFDEIFVNNIGEPNKLFKILSDGELKQIQLNNGLEPLGLGTGAAVADIDNDGILELLISHGESSAQPLSLFKYNSEEKNSYLRIRPLNIHGAPARGATVTLFTNKRTHSKTIDAGSGYLCQMEPVAHFGVRENEKEFEIKIKWTNGDEQFVGIESLNQTLTVRQRHYDHN